MSDNPFGTPSGQSSNPWAQPAPEAPAGGPVRPAGLWPRFGAFLVDSLLLGAVFAVFVIAFGDSQAETDEGFSFAFNLSGAPFLLYVVLFLGYYFALESTRQTTLGKAVLGLKVVRAADGGKPTTGNIAVRTILRFVDGLCGGLVGLIALLSTGETRRQRVGDIAAGTTVVEK